MKCEGGFITWLLCVANGLGCRCRDSRGLNGVIRTCSGVPAETKKDRTKFRQVRELISVRKTELHKSVAPKS